MDEATLKQLALSLMTVNTDHITPDQKSLIEAILHNVRGMFGDIRTSSGPGQGASSSTGAFLSAGALSLTGASTSTGTSLSNGAFSSTGPVPQIPMFLPGIPFNQPATDIFGQPRNAAQTAPDVKLFLNSMLSNTNNNADFNQPPQLDLEEADPYRQQPGLPGPSLSTSTGPRLQPRILASSVRSPSPSRPRYQPTPAPNKEPVRRPPYTSPGGIRRILRVLENNSIEDKWAQEQVANLTTEQRWDVLEAAAFAQNFKERRKKLRMSQEEVCGLVNKKYGTNFKVLMLSNFEKLKLTLNYTLLWRRKLEQWLIEIESKVGSASTNSIDITSSSPKPPALSPTPTEPAAAQDVQPTEEEEEEEEEEEGARSRPPESYPQAGQLHFLREYFSHNRRPNEEERQILAEKISMDEKSVCRWFEEERHRAQDIDDREYRTQYNLTSSKETDSVVYSRETGDFCSLLVFLFMISSHPISAS